MLKYEIHEADASKGYNFPFILIYPEQMQKNVKIFVEGNNSTEYIKRDKDNKVIGYQSFEEQRQDAIKFADFIVGPVIETNEWSPSIQIVCNWNKNDFFGYLRAVKLFLKIFK